MELKLELLEYQVVAINSVVTIFNGNIKNSFDNACANGIRSNTCSLSTEQNGIDKDELITEILIKNGFKLNHTLTRQKKFKKNEILLATDGDKETLICLDVTIDNETVAYFKNHTDLKLIVLERALDTTKKWNLKHTMGDKFITF